MKKVTALVLSFVLVLSLASCAQNNEPSGGEISGTETAGPTSVATSIGLPTEEAAIDPAEKWAYYNALFREGKLETAGESVRTTQTQGETTVDIRYESAGSDTLMLMLDAASGFGFGVYEVSGERYLYGKLKDGTSGNAAERLLAIHDPSFSMGQDKPDIDLDLKDVEFGVEYLSTKDGLDLVRLIIPEKEQIMDLGFNEDGKIVTISDGTAEAAYQMEFYDAESISLPAGVSPETVTEEEFGAFAMACLFSLMDQTGSLEPETETAAESESETEAVTEPAAVTPPSIQDTFEAELDLQVDYEGDTGTYTFDKLPKSAFDMEGLIQCCGLWTPYEAAAFFAVALHTDEENPTEADQMIRRLMVPETTDAEYKFIEGQLKEKPYLCDIYFRGVDLKTKKTPEAPYVIHVSKTTGADAGYTYVKVWTDAVGGDRTIVLKQIGKDYYVVKCPALLLSLGDQPY